MSAARALPSPRTRWRNRRHLRRSATGRSLPYNLRFPGQYYDTETGLNQNWNRDYDPIVDRYVESDLIGLKGGSLSTYAYALASPLDHFDPNGLAFCWFSYSSGHLLCMPDDPPPGNPITVDIPAASGNNGAGMQCKNNGKCAPLANRGPIPPGLWGFGGPGSSGKPNGRSLTAIDGTNTYGRKYIASHSCKNAFGPSLVPPFCSEGCVTSSAAAIQALNQLIDAEPGSVLLVTE
ncbi:MAG: RHS repeat-associated core domain-containing protein [Steroidobacteraceae bacterium]